MEINEFLKPYSLSISYSSNQIGSSFSAYEKGAKYKNAILVCGLSSLKGETKFLHDFREYFYSLASFSCSNKLVDLGDVISLSNEDRKEALGLILKEANKTKSTLLLLSANDFDDVKVLKGTAHIHVSPFIKDDQIKTLSKKKSGSITYIGVQSYFNFLESSKFESGIECISLGQLRDDMMDAEPNFRMADVASFNLSAIRKSDFSGSYNQSPNGLYAEEICQLGWFAGNSDTIKVYNVNNLNNQKNFDTGDTIMAAQLFWYILTGISKRYGENPSKNTRNFKEYYIENNKIPEDIVFYKSMKSEKFWVKYGQEDFFIPCSKKDMDVVLEGNISARLLRKIAVNQKK